MQIILQKIIAQSGYSSRRTAEEMVRRGEVKVNGIKALIGDTADPEKDRITVKGKLIKAAAEKIYLKLNKPVGYTCTNKKFPDEKNIFDLIKIPDRLFAIGRLDKNSRGLILLTNDGDLTQRLSHPKYNHEKVYRVTVREFTSDPNLITKKLLTGVDIGEGDGIAKAKKVQYLQNQTFIITLNEGKKRQIRRMFKILGLEVFDLERISFAGLVLGDLKEGRFEYLNPIEIKKLRS